MQISVEMEIIAYKQRKNENILACRGPPAQQTKPPKSLTVPKPDSALDTRPQQQPAASSGQQWFSQAAEVKSPVVTGQLKTPQRSAEGVLLWSQGVEPNLLISQMFPDPVEFTQPFLPFCGCVYPFCCAKIVAKKNRRRKPEAKKGTLSPQTAE
jgi:hypothetical protein